MRAVKGIYENGEVRLLDSPNLKGPVDIVVVFDDVVAATAEQREVEAEALLNELDAIAGSIEGEFDSASDEREIREERANRL